MWVIMLENHMKAELLLYITKQLVSGSAGRDLRRCEWLQSRGPAWFIGVGSKAGCLHLWDPLTVLGPGTAWTLNTHSVWWGAERKDISGQGRPWKEILEGRRTWVRPPQRCMSRDIQYPQWKFCMTRVCRRGGIENYLTIVFINTPSTPHPSPLYKVLKLLYILHINVTEHITWTQTRWWNYSRLKISGFWARCYR